MTRTTNGTGNCDDVVVVPRQWKLENNRSHACWTNPCQLSSCQFELPCTVFELTSAGAASRSVCPGIPSLYLMMFGPWSPYSRRSRSHKGNPLQSPLGFCLFRVGPNWTAWASYHIYLFSHFHRVDQNTRQWVQLMNCDLVIGAWLHVLMVKRNFV